MAITDTWERYLSQGYMPGSGDERIRVGSREDIYQNLLARAGEGGLGAYTQQDIYDFFIKPEEQARMAAAENRFRSLYGQAQRASQQRSGQLGRRLGFGGTGMGSRMARTVAGGTGGMAASRGLAAARKSASEQINQPGRLSRIEDLASTGRTADQRASKQEAAGVGAAFATPAAIAAGLLAASAGPQAAFTLPAGAIAALIGIGGATGALSGALPGIHEEEAMKRSDRKMRAFRGGPVRTANFAVDPVPGGAELEFNPMGSQAALSNAYRSSSNDEGSNFLY